MLRWEGSVLRNKGINEFRLTNNHFRLILQSLLVICYCSSSSHAACPPYPAFPDANCTGVLPGVARTNSGSMTTSSNGQVIENLNVNGTITVRHSNVTIRNVKVTNPGGVAITNIGCGTACTHL